jgi:hypothetical protein
MSWLVYCGATRHDFDVEVLIVDKLERADALLELDAVVGERRTPGCLSARRGVASKWLAQMKVVTVDSRAAYVGTSNSTILGFDPPAEDQASLRVRSPGWCF